MKCVINHQVQKFPKTFSMKSGRNLVHRRKEVAFLLYTFDERKELTCRTQFLGTDSGSPLRLALLISLEV